MDTELVVFDWSGTVIDDRRLVYETITRLLKTQNVEIMSFDEWLSFVSTSVFSGVLSEYLFTAYNIKYDDEKLRDLYRENLNKVIADGINSILYPDTLDVFKYICDKGKKIAVVSFQPEDHILKEANENGLAQFIVKIVGSAFDKSANLTRLCEELDVRPNKTLFVGDMVGDVQAAKEAGVIPVAVTTGYHSKNLLSDEKPTYLLSSLSDLKTII